MKKAMFVVLCIGLMTTIGCFAPGPRGPTGAGGVSHGMIYSVVDYPGENLSSTSYNFDKKDFTIIGEVTADANQVNYLGVYAAGDTGYATLYAEAKKKGADDVINVKLDTSYYNILGIIQRVESTLTGTAIKWK
ncbi:hypothetical protein ACFL1X_12175 [Candidatus Hydrogenedentota bacterium]